MASGCIINRPQKVPTILTTAFPPMIAYFMSFELNSSNNCTLVKEGTKR